MPDRTFHIHKKSHAFYVVQKGSMHVFEMRSVGYIGRYPHPCSVPETKTEEMIMAVSN